MPRGGKPGPRAEKKQLDHAEIMRLSRQGYSNVEIARMFGVGRGTIGRIVQKMRRG